MTYELPQAVLGRTGLRVTRLGVGGAYCESAEGYRGARLLTAQEKAGIQAYGTRMRASGKL